MFDRKSLGRWLILPIAALCLTQASARADFVINLTTANQQGSTLAGLDLFRNTDNQSTGTGVIQSFVRLSGNTDAIRGYNQSARPLQYDENSSPQFTRDLPLSAVPIVVINGVSYREFLLDINQTSNNPLLTLHELQIFTSANPIVSGAGTVTNSNVNGGAGGENFTLAGATKIYDLDAQNGTGAQIELDYNLNSGSGSGDMFAYIRSDLFTGNFVTLYSRFGPVQPNNDGFEEWAVRTVSAPPGFVVPEPTTIVTAFTGLPIGLAMLRRRFSRKSV